MSYHQDWLMQQIEAISTMLGDILFGKRGEKILVEPAAVTHSGDNALYRQLQAMVRQGKLCEAENLLYESLEAANEEALEAAKLFYDDLNALSDEDLQTGNFSRQEIYEGLQMVCRAFGIPL